MLFPATIDLVPGSFVLTLTADGSVSTIPHVATVDVDPTQPQEPVAITLCGPKPLDAWRATTDPCSGRDLLYALVIPDEPGKPVGATWPAYKSGCTVFDGVTFDYCDGHHSVQVWLKERVKVWRAARGLPPLTVDEPGADA